jgi:hypothetical protein
MALVTDREAMASKIELHRVDHDLRHQPPADGWRCVTKIVVHGSLHATRSRTSGGWSCVALDVSNQVEAVAKAVRERLI